MSERINLADPGFEPTDEQLIGLSQRAFAGVREANARGLQKMRAEIAASGEQSLPALEQRMASRKPT